MPVPTEPASGAAPAPSGGGLLRSRKLITAARARGATPSDGGGTGRSDGND
ncbi:hypothetical protein [Streptomyces sp. bgisy153]|uniref:hypothetical protein n=1 Tax=Streptomyces sp. bgisy153 TaxID=3413793 RepID=UPI003D734DAC